MLPSHIDRADRAIRESLLSSKYNLKPSKEKVSKWEIKHAQIGYMLCSSLMLITNKVAVHNAPAPSFVLWSQMASAALFCFIFGSLGFFPLDSLQDTKKIKSYVLVAFVFLSTIFANIKILQYCNVETFIVVRASTPIAVSIGDYFWLGRELPSKKSWLMLIGLLFGTIIYVKTDSQFKITGYLWVIVWYIVFCSDQLAIKYICNKVKLQSNWSRVYYTNFVTSIPLSISFIYNQELANVEWTFYPIFFVVLSCVIGLGMSYYAFKARNLVSAAQFTVLGNACKVITVGINLLIWEKHANIYGLGALGLCLLCAKFYEQAPLRKAVIQKRVRRSENLLKRPSDV